MRKALELGKRILEYGAWAYVILDTIEFALERIKQQSEKFNKNDSQ
jgi:hypothetical protein